MKKWKWMSFIHLHFFSVIAGASLRHIQYSFPPTLSQNGSAKRAGTAYGPYISIDGTSKRRTVKTYYEDSSLRVRVETDLFNEGDALLKTRETKDQLGRIIKSEKNENGAANFSISSENAYNTQNRVVVTSNPHRSTSSSADGWTRATTDVLGRPIEVATFSDASQPPTSGINSNFTGSVITAYSENITVVTDQAGNKRRSIGNALQQLVRVDEPNDSGQLDVSGVPIQSTFYSYDVIGNLVQITQGDQTRTFSYDSLSRLGRVVNPESGIVDYTYDRNGNIKTKRDARGIKTIYDYDGLNRAVQKCYRVIGTGPLGATTCSGAQNETLEPNTFDTTFVYDSESHSKGILTKVITGNPLSPFSITELKEFDPIGRAKKSKQTTDGTTYNEMQYKYDLTGAVIEETYPSGRVVKGTLNNSSTLSKIQSKASSNEGYWTYASNFSYTATGVIDSLQVGNGHWESTTYNNRFQPTQMALGATRGATNLMKLEYIFGLWENGVLNSQKNNGNVAQQIITTPSSGSTPGFEAIQKYSYDPLNRLKQANETVSGNQVWKQTFTYDRYGNRNFDEANTTTILKQCSEQGLPAVCANDKKLYNPTTDLTSNRLATGDNYEYDDTGNMTEDARGAHFIYDAENRLVEVKNAQNQTIGKYFYDGEGKRVKKYVQSSQETTIFVYNGLGLLVAEYSTLLSQDPQVAYLTTDSLGSPRMNTGASGNVIARHDYHPFGEEISSSQRTSNLGYHSDDITIGFTGYKKDEETGLDFAKNRYYQSGLGRFTSPDPIYFQAKMLADPQRYNLFVYVRNNPFKYIDPDGQILKLAGQKAWLMTMLQNWAGEFADKLSLSEDGTVSFDVNPDEIKDNEGAKLIYDLVKSSATILFYIGNDEEEAGSFVEERKGEKNSRKDAKNDFTGKGMKHGGGYFLATRGRVTVVGAPPSQPVPNDGIFAVVAVNIDAEFYEVKGKADYDSSRSKKKDPADLAVPISAMFMHEGAESVEFANMSKGGRTLDGDAYKEAHSAATTREENIRKQVKTPLGEGRASGKEIRTDAPKNEHP
jgi:RHS repeat-associated protein